ncbi:MAG: hypothetical protein FLDDKLPJ_03204 [Phycisphaerae bacterium]|nr:hypothetical protein [Phycisphaerae bacterium]
MSRMFCVGSLILFLASGCSVRQSGQQELFVIEEATMEAYRPLSHRKVSPNEPIRSQVIPTFGDRIQSTDDVVSIVVDSVFIADLPPTWSSVTTGSHDVLAFVEVQESEPTSLGNKTALTRILYAKPDDRDNRKLNFNGAIAYGPTYFKGRQLGLKFSIMVLQKRKTEQQARIVKAIADIGASANPEFAGVVSELAGMVKSILSTQPDVEVFDFHAVLVPYKPSGLRPTAAEAAGGVQPTAASSTSSTYAAHAAFVPGTEAARTWDERTAWLSYNRFAIIDTLARNSGAPLPLGFGQKDRLWHDGGWMFVGGEGPKPPLGWDGTRRALDSNYLVFAILPGLQAEEDARLWGVSQHNRELIASLTRSQASIAQSIEDIGAHGAKLVTEYIRVQAERKARDLAQKEADKQNFMAKFNTFWTNIIAPGVAKLPDDQRNVINAIKSEVIGRWTDKDGWGATNSTTNPPPVGMVSSDAATAEAKVAQFVLSRYQVALGLPENAVRASYDAAQKQVKVTVEGGTRRKSEQGGPVTDEAQTKEIVDALHEWLGGSDSSLPKETQPIVTLVDFKNPTS